MRQIYFYLVIIGINLFNISYSQKTEKLLIVNFQNKEYFAPDIINYLNGLVITKEDKIVKAFDNIIVLNQLQNHVTEQAGIKNLTDYFKQDSKYKDLSKEAKKIYDTISKNLGDYNSLLDINVNQINELIEIQFSLYSNILKKGNNTFATKDPRYPDRFESAIFVPLESNYWPLVEKKIKKLFPETNISPTSIIAIDGKRNIVGEEFYYRTGDTISLDGRYSSDPDSRREDLIYNWREINIPSNQTAASLIDYNNPKITLSFSKQGKYYFGLKVFDGISYSLEDTICVKVIVKPKIYIENRNIKFVYQDANFKSRKKPPLKYCLNIASNSYNTQPSFLVVKDLNEDIYLNTFDPLQIAGSYLSGNRNVPSLDTIRNSLLYKKYSYYKRTITLDSITTPLGGYKLYFSGFPSSGIYSFQIHEQYQGVSSNYYIIDFTTNILSMSRLNCNLQRISLVSSKSVSWSDAPPQPQLSNVSDTTFKYQYYNNNIFLSGYLTRKLVFELNLSLPINQARSKNQSTKYMPLIQLNYEFGRPDYHILDPVVSLGYFASSKTGGFVFGYGINFVYSIRSIMFFYYGIQYLRGLGNDFKGVAPNIGLKIDVVKIFDILDIPISRNRTR